MKVGAPSCILRHECRSYGTQQLRKLSNSFAREKGTLSGHVKHVLFLIPKSLRNKWWVRQVPAAAVIPAPQMVITFIGFKVPVGGLASSW